MRQNGTPSNLRESRKCALWGGVTEKVCSEAPSFSGTNSPEPPNFLEKSFSFGAGHYDAQISSRNEQLNIERQVKISLGHRRAPC
jgi:hypothetical protein